MNAPASARDGAALYTPEILALAVELADYPLTQGLPLQGEAHSRICGSRVCVSVAIDSSGRIVRVGARVMACAIGQAAAALFLKGAACRNAAEVAATLEKIEDWLGGSGGAPDWPGLTRLERARHYPGRHAAILLPWKAALAALSNPAAAG